MGFKAKIRERDAYIKYLQLRCNALNAALKEVIRKASNEQDGPWVFIIPIFEDEEVNKTYKITTASQGENYIMTVERKELDEA